MKPKTGATGPVIFGTARAGSTISKADGGIDPKISIIKTPTLSASTTDAKILVDYKVVVTNQKNARQAFRTVLIDTLYDPQQKVMSNRSWPLDTLEPGDQVTLSYTVEFPSTSKPGVYKNVARITGQRNETTYVPAILKMPDTEASSEIELVEKPQPQVLGASTAPEPEPAACTPLLTETLRRGSRNSAEVKKLQQFLNGEMGTTLPQSGVYGPMTESAVRAFQEKYADEILAPNGLSRGTGYVGPSTLAKINELACGGAPVDNAAPTVAAAAAVSSATPSPAPIPPPAPAPVKQKTVKPKTVAKEPAKVEKPAGFLGGWFSQFAPKGKSEK